MEVIPSIAQLATTAIIHLLRLLPAIIVLSVLENIFGTLRRSYSGRSARTDIGFLLLSLLYAPLLRHFGTFLAASFLLEDGLLGAAGDVSAFARQPLWVQVFGVLLIRDVLIYVRHRIFHGRSLWKFHAIHHSSEQVNWLSTVRFHPCEALIEVTINLLLFWLLAPSPDAIVVIALIMGFYDYFIHADIPLRFGPLDFIFVSPIFHRWHHSVSPEARNKNFASMFSFLDLALGTFYLPQNKYPAQTGISGMKLPETLWGQLRYPFRMH